MNRVVRLGDLLVRQGVLGIVLLLPCVFGGQQLNAQSQTVPDAPTPQQQPGSLGNLKQGVTPGSGSQETPQDNGTNTTQVPPAAGSQPSGPDQVQQAPPIIPPAGQRNKDITTFSTRVDYVTVPVTVLDKKHQQVAGLTWRDFQIYENGVRQRIAHPRRIPRRSGRSRPRRSRP